MKCDSCIHKQVCKDKPPESYPRVMIDIMTDKCEHYIHIADVPNHIRRKKNSAQLRGKNGRR